MSLNKCSNCGCDDSFLTSPAPCPTPAGCPNPEPCSEVYDAECIAYTGANITAGTNIVIPADTDIATALQLIVNYFCVSVVAYSNVLDFNTVLDSMRYYCNGVQLDVKYGSSQSNITDYVTMLNTNTNFNIYGQYFDNGDGRVKLIVPCSKAKSFCPGGTISLVGFYD